MSANEPARVPGVGSFSKARFLRQVAYSSLLIALVLLPCAALSSREPAEQTLAIIKPDAVRAGLEGKIKEDIKAAGFSVVSEKKLAIDHDTAAKLYAEHAERPFFPALVHFMTSGPAVALVLEKEQAVAEWRQLMGPTCSATARAGAPSSIRAKYGVDGRRNAVHGSESPERAKEEIQLLFAYPPSRPGLGQLSKACGLAAVAAIAGGACLLRRPT